MKKALVVTFLILGLVAVGFVLVEKRSKDILTLDVMYAVDVEDPRKLAGFADNIFLGKVTATHGTVYRKGHRTAPWTRYDVAISKNVKGKLDGTVSVLQEGGHSPEDGRMHLISGDQILAVDEEYLFVTRADEASNLHVIVPVYGNIHVKDTGDRQALIEAFTAAVERQVPFRESQLERN